MYDATDTENVAAQSGTQRTNSGLDEEMEYG
jgi:hypothetical protein